MPNENENAATPSEAAKFFEREITTHHTNAVNRCITLNTDAPNPQNGNAAHRYVMRIHPGPDRPQTETLVQALFFQNGPVGEVGCNGVTNEVLLAIVIDRLQGFQSSKWACAENQVALDKCKSALAQLEQRTRGREARGVEGTHTV